MTAALPLLTWKVVFHPEPFQWTRDVFVVAPTIEQAIGLAKMHPPVDREDFPSMKTLRVVQCEKVCQLAAVWQPPHVVPKRPTDEQVAALEVERLLGEQV